jgi:hypothetical protein
MSTAAAAQETVRRLASATIAKCTTAAHGKATDTTAAAHTFISFLYLLKPPLGKIIPFVTVRMPLLQAQKEHCEQTVATSR